MAGLALVLNTCTHVDSGQRHIQHGDAGDQQVLHIVPAVIAQCRSPDDTRVGRVRGSGD